MGQADRCFPFQMHFSTLFPSRPQAWASAPPQKPDLQHLWLPSFSLGPPWGGRWGLLQHPGWASPYSVSTMGRLEETCQGANEQGCSRTAQKIPRWWGTWSLGSLWRKCHLPESPLCSLVFMTVQWRAQSAEMGFKAVLCCLGLGLLNFSPCSLCWWFGVGSY